MISFSCSQCGMKIKVKPEFAGRSSKCPTCKKPLVVPLPDKTQAEVRAGQIDGTDSSLAKAGVDAGVTLEQMASAARPGSKSIQELLARRARNDGRYIIEGEIARGGMGTILRAVDCDIRREVAVKYLLNQTDARKKARFVEEAQITGQLEHPNIVPIHELGVDSLKRLFFSMKMVKGRSLAQVLNDLRQNPKAAEKEYSLRRLLNIFVNVCNALAYAHARGVVHRDLKPANIMIGDFGEVYVMDWGLAKVVKGGEAAEKAGPPAVAFPPSHKVATPIAGPSQSISARRSSKVETSREPEADLTQEGAIIGTPVYMPPEQAAGQVDAINQRSDIYSLGAILYEMLTLQPPIDKEGGYLTILMRVIQGEIVPPEQRNPQRAKAGKLPKEISAVAMKALAKNPQDRYPNVEALRRDIERFQEGRSVSAKEDTKREMIWKFVKRNKAFSAATVVVAVVLLWSSVVNYQARWQIQDRTEKAVPALVGAARLSGESRNLDEALDQLDLALTYSPTYAPAHLLRGQVLIAKKEFSKALTELEQYLKAQPQNREAQELAKLCQNARPADGERLLAISTVLQRQKAPGLAACLWQDVAKLTGTSEKLLPVLRQRIETAWPGLGNRLTMDKEDGGLRLNLRGCGDQVRDLSALQGMPLVNLNLGMCAKVQDFSPLRGMPLTRLDLLETGVQELTFLKDMPLTSLNLHGCRQLADLTPLKGMPLTTLSLAECEKVPDLTALQGMPLRSLTLAYCPVRDLTPLKGMPLIGLDLHGCRQVSDLTPLQGMELTEFQVTVGYITRGKEVFRRMKSLTKINGMPAEEFWKKHDAGEFNK